MSIRAAIAFLVGASAAGCSFNADFSNTHYMCVGLATTCPPGYTCVNVECVMGSDGGHTIDSNDWPDAMRSPFDSMPTPDAGPTLASCGAMEVLHDDFGDGVVSSNWPWQPFTDTGATVSEGGGDLIVSLAAGSGDVWGGYGSTAV